MDTFFQGAVHDGACFLWGLVDAFRGCGVTHKLLSERTKKKNEQTSNQTVNVPRDEPRTTPAKCRADRIQPKAEDEKFVLTCYQFTRCPFLCLMLSLKFKESEEVCNYYFCELFFFAAKPDYY